VALDAALRACVRALRNFVPCGSEWLGRMSTMQAVCPAGGSSDAAMAGVRAALRADGRWAHARLQPLPDKGLAHMHVRLAGTGVLARVPKQSQLGLAPEANLRHQAACFRRAEASGHSPQLLGVLPVSAQLPRGALLVEEIAGRPAQLPGDLGAIARALAAVHGLPTPRQERRAPLASPADPLRSLVEEILCQAAHVPAAQLEPAARQLLEPELAWLQRLVQRGGRPGVRLIAFDAHPGNFLLRESGAAVLVDLEKCRYGYPGLDLAHATLYTSTTWDVAARAVLSLDEVAGFYAAWEAAMDSGGAAAARPWHIALRRAMWLWSLTWCCKWRVLSARAPAAPQAGEDWSAVHSEAALVAHVRERVDHYLSPAILAQVSAELHALQEAFG
jgi:Ser/Thr protein kinase RdoA (MazF antagonist)